MAHLERGTAVWNRLRTKQRARRTEVEKRTGYLMYELYSMLDVAFNLCKRKHRQLEIREGSKNKKIGGWPPAKAWLHYIELPEDPTDVTSVPLRATPSVAVGGSITMLDNFELMPDNKSLVPAAGVTVVVAALVFEFVFVVLSVVADEYGNG